MRIIRIVAIVLGVWVLLGLSLAAGIGYFQPRGPDTVVLRTFDATGQAHETVLRVREDNGQLYMKAKKFDRDFDAGKDVTSALNVSMARRGKQAEAGQRRFPCLDDRRAGQRGAATGRYAPVDHQGMAGRAARTVVVEFGNQRASLNLEQEDPLTPDRAAA